MTTFEFLIDARACNGTQGPEFITPPDGCSMVIGFVIQNIKMKYNR